MWCTAHTRELADEVLGEQQAAQTGHRAQKIHRHHLQVISTQIYNKEVKKNKTKKTTKKQNKKTKKQNMQCILRYWSALSARSAVCQRVSLGCRWFDCRFKCVRFVKWPVYRGSYTCESSRQHVRTYCFFCC